MLTIVIPVYGAEEYLEKCLNSIPEKYKIIIVDDKSPKRSTKKFLNSIRRKNTTIIYNSLNLGFAKTVNRGIEKADTEFVLSLNSDIEFVDDKCIQNCLDLLKKDLLIGVVGIKLLYADGTIQHAGMEMNWNDRGGNSITRGQYEPNLRYNSVEEMLFVTGAFMMMRKTVFNEVGGLPTCYGKGYYEDPDFCVRLRQCGYKTIYNGSVWAYHYANKSFNEAGLPSETEVNFRTFQKRNLAILREWSKR